MSSKLLARSAQGASFLILLQVASRALTFIVNQVLLRFLSPQILGIATQLELFSISTLYFSRESARVVLQRQASDGDGESSTKDSKKKDTSRALPRSLDVAISLSSISILIGLPLSLLFRHTYAASASAELLESPNFVEALDIYTLATVLELVHEPLFAVAQHDLSYGIRTSAELLATIARCLVTCTFSMHLYRQGQPASVLPFAIGQLTYSILLNLSYAIQLRQLPQLRALSHFHIPRSLLKLTATLYGQSLFKQLLTSGDSYLISLLTSLESQGAYALATNYGSLLARLLFQPIEEASRTLLSRLLAQPSSPSAQSAQDEKTPKNQEPSSANVAQASRYIHTILHLYTLMSLILVLLPPVIPSALAIIAGPQWANTLAPSVLAAYLYYLPLLAFNGLLEAYVASVATPSQLRQQSAWMVAWSLIFAVSGWIVLDKLAMGARGLVWANCATMVGRIGWSWLFVDGDLKTRGEALRLSSIVPQQGLGLGFAIAGRATLESLNTTQGTGALLRMGAILAVTGLAILFAERYFLVECWNMIKPKR